MWNDKLAIVFRTLTRHGLQPILVGGAVRDLLLKRRVNDYDFGVQASPSQLVGLIKALSSAAGCTVIPLDVERGVIRYCFSADFTIDVAVFKGASLEDDLRARDFTVNAMAMDGEGRVIDPTGGQRDLEAGLVRALGPDALREDPLRVLRGLRLAAKLGFSIEDHTREWLLQQAPGLQRVAGERISEELFKLFRHADLELMEFLAEMRVFQHLFGRPVSPDAWEELWLWYGRPVARKPGKVRVRAERTDRELGILALLWQPWVQHGVEVETLQERLKLSRQEVDFLQRWWRGREQFLEQGELSRRDLYRLVTSAGNALGSLLGFAQALDWADGATLERIRTAAEGKGDLRLQPLPLTGGDVIKLSGGSGGRWVSRVMKELELAWACKEVKHEEALREMALRLAQEASSR